MTNISTELAIESLWQALDWESPDKLTELFDQLASKLHHHPQFRGMSITEIDLILTTRAANSSTT
jgi:hypothetical protein